MDKSRIEAVYPLSPSQHGILIASVSAPGSGSFLEITHWTIRGRLDPAALEEACSQLQSRHAALRTCFVWKSRKQPLQVVLRAAPLPVTCRDLTGCDAAAREQSLRQFIAAEQHHGFDLARAPLFRLALARTGEDTWSLVWTHHHAVIDGWCWPVLFRELFEIYSALTEKRVPELAPVQPFAGYLAWLRDRDYTEDERFWKTNLAGARGFSPLSQPRNAAEPDGGHGLASGAMDGSAAAALGGLCRQQRVTPSALVHGAWALLLSHLTGRGDVMFGTTVSGRPADLPGVESMLGLFMNTVPLRTPVPADGRFWPWLREFQNRQLSVRAHEFNSAGQIHQWSGLPATAPLYDSTVVFENLPANLLRFDAARAGFTIEMDRNLSRVAQTPLPVTLRVTPALEIEMIHRRDRLDGTGAAALLGQFTGLLAAVAALRDPDIGKLRQGFCPNQAGTAVPSLPAGNPRLSARTPTEERVLEIWRQVLQVESAGIADNFFAMGGHSLLAAQLLTGLEAAFEIPLPLRALLESPTPAGLARAIEEHRLGDELRAGRSAIVACGEDQQHEPFPLTEIQQAYWIGRGASLELGNVATHNYLEVDAENPDLERFEWAWRQLIRRHGMLRAIIEADGAQRILAQVPEYRIETTDLRDHGPDARAAFLEAVRGRMSHQILAADRWPLFEIRASRLDEQVVRLHISFDVLIADGHSLQLLARELSLLYAGQEDLPRLDITFRDYVLAERELCKSAAWNRAREYWRARLDEIPPAPELPLARDPGSIEKPHFVRRSLTLDVDHWTRLRAAAASFGLTPSAVLLTAFACTLARWSKNADLTLNVTLFNRLPLHPQVGGLVGDFTSLILLAVDNSTEGSFEQRARRVQRRLWEDLDHSLMSGIEVLREMHAVRGQASRIGMPVVFTSALGNDDSPARAPAMPGKVVYGISQTPQVWLDCQVSEMEGALIVNWDAVEALFPAGVITFMFAAHTRLLESLARGSADWTAPVDRVWLPEEQRQVRAIANGAAAPLPDGLLQSGVAARAAENPGQPALVSAAIRLSYGELMARANRLGRLLRGQGAKPGELAAIVMAKGCQQAVAALGILASGAAYLPIDSALPEERIRYLLANAEARFAVTDGQSRGVVSWPSEVRVICLDDPAVLEGIDPSPLPARQSPDDLAYVIYTSGSTGEPKGVMIDHRAAMNTIADVNRRFAVGPSDRVLALSSLSFDLSVWDLFGILGAGGTVVLPEPEAARDPVRWLEWLHQEQVTVWNSVPALMEMLVEAAEGSGRPLPSSLRLVLLSGDWIPVSLPERIGALAPQAAIYSLGGATEASIWSIAHEIGTVGAEWKSIPYGRPLANQQFHVLNQARQPCPDWVAGELYIGGAGLARGYWRDPERTAERFVEHAEYGRLYRTGDLGRYRPDGVIEFLGRDDAQVKIQGYRVELGEVEAALLRHPGVREAVVAAHMNASGSKQLAAYIVPRAGLGPDSGVLADHLRQTLPAYMIPATFTAIGRIPVTANGKVNRRALPPPISAGPSAVPLETPLAASVSQVIRDLLHLEDLDPDRNLFSLGASSVEIIRIATRIEKALGFRIGIEDIFRNPTLRGLSALCRVPAPASASGTSAASGIADPASWALIKQQAPGLRQDLTGLPRAELGEPLPQGRPSPEYVQRCSHRRFAAAPLPSAALSSLFTPLRQIFNGGKPKRRYASAGGLYPVQAYLYIRPGSVEDLAGGIYYYHPVEHVLLCLAPDVRLDPAIHDPFVNRSFAGEAAFTIFLVMRAKAIKPIYGEHSSRFAAIEAGLMSQLLDDAAPGAGVGLCHIGSLDFRSIRHLFSLEENDEFVHCLVGGAPVNQAEEMDGMRASALQKLAQLDPSIVPAARPDTPPAGILLTGSTGFLGAWLLRELLDRGAAEISCLIRAGSSAEGMERLRQSLDAYQLWLPGFEQRLRVIPGDLSRRQLGLSRPAFDDLAQRTGTIYHLAAQVNFVYPYSALEETNVRGTSEILRLACTGSASVLHYVSSVAVFPLWLPGPRRVFREDQPLDHGELLLGGYAQSKWVAEQLVRVAAARGLRVVVYRPGGVTGHSRSGLCDRNSFLSRALKSYIQLGAIPKLDFDLEMVPVDFVSRAIAAISHRDSSLGGTFHLVGPEPLSLGSLAAMLRQRGRAVEEIPYEAWLTRLHAHHDSGRPSALAPFLPLFERRVSDAETGGSSRFDSRNAEAALAASSIICPPLDEKLIRTYLDYFDRTGFLEDGDGHNQ